MPSAIVKGLAAIVVVLLLTGLALGLALPRLLETEAVRARVRDEARSLIGAHLDWERMEGRLRPLSVTLQQPALDLDPESSASAPDSEASGRTTHAGLWLRWTAPHVDARFALAALVRGRVEVEALESSGGTLRLRDRWGARDVAGRLDSFAWRARPVMGVGAAGTPVAPAAVDVWLSGRPGPSSEVELVGRLDRASAAAFAFDAERIRVRVAGLELVGRGALRVRPTGEGALAFDAEIDLGEGGRAMIDGRRDAAGGYALHARLDGLDLAPAAILLARVDLEIAGRATGEVRLSGDAAAEDRASVDLDLADARFRIPDVVATGDLPIEATVQRPFSDRPRGRLALDLTEATVVYRGGLRKPAGIGATLDTKFTPDASGRLVFESRVALRDLDQILSPEVLGRFAR